MIGGIVTLALAAPSSAVPQQVDRSYEASEALVPIDQSVGDVNALSASLRERDRGLEQPVGFSQVYRVPGFADRYMRISGGIYAVFPQSVYIPTQAGLAPDIPPNTIFYIGSPPVADTTAPTRPPVDTTRVSADSRRAESFRVVGQRAPDAVPWSMYDRERPPDDFEPTRPIIRPLRSTEPEVDATTVVNDEAYRRARVQELLRRAAHAARAG